MTPVDAAYYRRYRVLHGPAIRAREKVRRQQPAVRVARHEADNRRRKRITAAGIEEQPLPPPHRGHEMYDRAREVVGEPWYGNQLYDPLKEDAIGEVVLAFLEGTDPEVAAKAYFARESQWRIMTCEPMEER